MRSIRLLLWLPALLAAGCGGGNSDDPAPIRVPAIEDISPAALAAASDDGVEILQRVSGATLTLTTALPDNPQLRTAESNDGASAHLLLAAGAASRLLLVDGLPDAPVLQAELSLPGARDLVANDDSLYVLSASTLHEFSLDHSLQRSLALPAEDARSVALSGAYAYVAAGAGGLLTVDLSRNEPQPVSVNTATALSVEDITVAGDFAYLAEGAAGLGLFDISEGDAVADFGNFNLLDCLLDTGVRAVEVLVRENLHYAYLEQFQGRARLAVFDTAVPGQLPIAVPVSGLSDNVSCQTLPFALGGMQLADDGSDARLGGRCCEGLYAMISLSDEPLRPQVQALLPAGVRALGGSGRLYSLDTDRNTLQAQNYAVRQTSRTAAAEVIPAFGFDLHLTEEHAYIVHSGGVVRAALARTQTRKTAEYLSFGLLSAAVLAPGAAASTPLLYAGFDSGARIELWRLDQIDYAVVSTSAAFVSRPGTPTVTPPAIAALLLAEGVLFVADATGRIQALRDAGERTLRDFALTEQCGLEGAASPCLRLPAAAHALAYRAPHLYAGTADGGLHVLRLRERTLETVAVVRISTPAADAGGVAAIVLAGDFAYVSAHAAGVHVLDIRTPARIHRRSVLHTQPGAFGMAVQGALLYVAAGDSVEVYALDNPAAPVRLPELRVPGFAFTLAARADALHILERYGWRDYYRILRPRPQP